MNRSKTRLHTKPRLHIHPLPAATAAGDKRARDSSFYVHPEQLMRFYKQKNVDNFCKYMDSGRYQSFLNSLANENIKVAEEISSDVRKEVRKLNPKAQKSRKKVIGLKTKSKPILLKTNTSKLGKKVVRTRVLPALLKKQQQRQNEQSEDETDFEFVEKYEVKTRTTILPVLLEQKLQEELKQRDQKMKPKVPTYLKKIQKINKVQAMQKKLNELNKMNPNNEVVKKMHGVATTGKPAFKHVDKEEITASKINKQPMDESHRLIFDGDVLDGKKDGLSMSFLPNKIIINENTKNKPSDTRRIIQNLKQRKQSDLLDCKHRDKDHKKKQDHHEPDDKCQRDKCTIKTVKKCPRSNHKLDKSRGKMRYIKKKNPE